MASIKQRPDGAWRARYRDTADREHSRHFKLKRDAQRWLEEVSTSIITGQYVDPRSAKTTFREYADDWLAAQVHRDATATLYAGHLTRHAYPTLGNLQLGRILTTTIQRWVKGLSTATEERPALAPATVGVVYTIVATVFRSAVRDRQLAVTPCEGIRLPEIHKSRVAPLTTEQVEALTELIPAELEAIVILAAGTGMRQGEALGLTRDRLRLLGKNPVVTVDRQLVTKPGGETAFALPKTKASIRTIPLPRVVITALNEHIAKYNIGEHDLLFTWQGKALTRQRFGHLWRPAAKTAKLTSETGTGMHALRHYYASLLIRYGESVKVVQERLGHASASETLDTYSHLWEDSDDRTRDAVDSVLGARADSADFLRTSTADISENPWSEHIL